MENEWISYNNQNTGYPPPIPRNVTNTTNTNTFRPHPYLMNTSAATIYPTSVPSVQQHNIQPQPPYVVPQISLQPQPVYTQTVAVPVQQPQAPRPPQTDDNKITKFMDEIRLVNDKTNKRMDELLLNINLRIQIQQSIPKTKHKTMRI